MTPEQARKELARRELARRSQLQEPTSPSSQPSNLLANVLGAGALGTAGYGAYKIAQPIGRGVKYIAKGIANIPNVANTEKSANFAKFIREKYLKAGEYATERFGKDLEKWQQKYPNATVDVGSIVNDIRSNPTITNEALNVVKREPTLRKILDNPELNRPLSNVETQNIINYLSSSPTAKKNFDLREIINDIKVARLESFPDMTQTNAEYRNFIEPYKNVKNYFKFNKTLPAITSEGQPFGGAEGWESVKQLLPKTVIDKIKGYRAGSRLTRIPSKVPLLGRFLSVAPQITDVMKFQQDPEAYGLAQETGQDYWELKKNLAPIGSVERKIQLKQVA